MPDRPKLYLIDGHALAYRTYFALSSIGGGTRFTTQAGEPTAGVYGFASTLLRLITEDSPEYLAVSFDTGRTFRDDLYPEYKATRQKMPEDLVPQIERIHQLVSAFGIPTLELEGYEADDVLGAVAKQAAEEGVHVYILTGDRDLLQLADENITIRLAGHRLSDAKDYTPREVLEKMGVQSSQIVDYKAMVGDSSDNIPGVRGVGEKTAVKLLKKYETLDNIYAHLEEVQTRFRNKLAEAQRQAYLSRELARIVTDLPLEFDLEACRTLGYSRDKVVELFRELEFHSLLDRLPEAKHVDDLDRQLSLFTTTTEPSPLESTQATIVRDKETLEKLVQEMQEASAIAFDVETTSTDVMRADLVGIAIAVDPLEGYYIPTGHHPGLGGSEQLELSTVLSALRDPLTNPKIPKVGHNLKYDYIMLARNNLRVKPLSFDTMIAMWLLDPGSRNLGLKKLAWVRLGIEMTAIGELIGSGRDQKTMAEVSVAKAAPYAAADARVCLSLMPKLEQELKDKALFSLFREVEMPLVPILADMEIAGILLDREFLAQFSADLTARLDEIENQVYEMVGHPFNLNSTQQLSKVLFDELALTPPDRTRKTASGHYSTAASVLEELQEVHPIVNSILEHREISKLRSTYADALPKEVNPHTKRVHTSYNQTGSVTGRIASSDPNLQNIPIRTEIGRTIRRAFTAPPGNLLLSVDYSQIELRVVAHIAEDETMIEAFLADQDIHATTAATVFNIRPEEVTPEMRRRAKAVNFGLIYGMSPYGLTRTTDLTLAEAEDFVDRYFERFPGVRSYLEKTRQFAAEKGYVETLLGRRRYFPELTKGGPHVSQPAKARAQREAINAPIQGTAADIIKIAMLRVPDALDAHGLAARMLLQVHDELVFECPQEELETTSEKVQKVMQKAAELRVPLKTDAKAGHNWAEMKPLV